MIVVDLVDGGAALAVRAPFAMKDALKAIPGARWHPTSKTWRYPATRPSAARLAALDHCVLSPEAEALLEASDVTVREDRLRTALKQHQIEAAEFALRGRCTVIAHSMGGMKTLTSLTVLVSIDARLSLVLAPLSVCRVWPAQAEEHLIDPPLFVDVSQGTAKKRIAEIDRAVAISAQRPTIVMANHHCLLTAAGDHLLMIKWDALVLDEIHAFKSAAGKMSRFVSRLADRVPVRLGLTGTLIPHSPMDLYAQFRAIDKSIFGTSAANFRARYAVMGGYGNHQILSWRNEDELREKIQAIAHVRTKKEILAHLPPLTFAMRECVLEPEALRIYEALEEEMVSTVPAHVWEKFERTGEISAPNVLVQLLRLQQMTGGEVVLDDGRAIEVSTAKRKLLRETLEEIGSGEPVVVVCRFNHDVLVVREVCAQLGRACGEVTGNTKDLTDTGKFPPDLNTLAINQRAGGLGIDLTRAAHMIMYSLGYSYGDWAQVRDRVHRPGQARNTHITALVTRQTVDGKVWRMLEARERVAEKIIAPSRSRAAPHR